MVLNIQQNIKKSLKTRKSKLGMAAHVGIPALRRGQKKVDDDLRPVQALGGEER